MHSSDVVGRYGVFGNRRAMHNQSCLKISVVYRQEMMELFFLSRCGGSEVVFIFLTQCKRGESGVLRNNSWIQDERFESTTVWVVMFSLSIFAKSVGREIPRYFAVLEWFP